MAAANTNGPAETWERRIEMFVADVLRDGSETLPSILETLNDRRLLRWRNSVLQDFAWDDTAQALSRLLSRGFVEAFAEDQTEGGRVQLVRDWSLERIRKAPDKFWYRLTRPGREATEAWNPPGTLDEYLVQLVRQSPTPLYSAQQELSRQIGSPIPFDEFADLIDSMLELDELHLLQMENGTVEVRRLSAVPRHPDHLNPTPTANDLQRTGRDYVLVPGNRPLEEPSPACIEDIPDPGRLIHEIVSRYPNLQDWLDRQGVVRHILVFDCNKVTIGTGDLLEFLAAMRLERGLPGIEDLAIRHIVLDEKGNVQHDFYGPASSDPQRK